MRIAQVAPLYESVPPKLYGGTERVVSWLTEELVRLGHEVTLFASGDSQTAAKLVAACPQALWRDERCRETLPHHVRQMELVFQDVSRFDVIHFHCDYLHFPLLRRHPCASVTTLHGQLHVPDQGALFEEYADVPLIAISDEQRRPMPRANWQGTVYHGLPRDLHTFGEGSGDYLAFLGRVSPEKGLDRAITIARRGLDGVVRRTLVELTPAPSVLLASAAHFDLALGPRQEAVFTLTVGCERQPASPRLLSFEEARTEAGSDLERYSAWAGHLHTSNGQINAWVSRAVSDLHMLTTELPTGPYPYAGVPWFNTPFGRDGLVTALECLWLRPALARGVLSYLASTQATAVVPEEDAEPGKVLHETRNGEMAALKEMPFGRYYGSADATPLFVLLAGAYFERTGDRAFASALWPHVEAALGWIDHYGDRDGDGFVEYQRQSGDGLTHQGWKDSDDAVFHADGSPAQGPIALCEVQGYVYAARRAGAALAAVLGHGERADALARQAEELRERFERAFWCEELSTYALALDGDKRPCRVRTSNAGQCLFTGIAGRERAGRVAETLLSSESFSGWGIRTVAASEARYNPMAYHNGSVWPHDNALIAQGLARYGLGDAALRIWTGLFGAGLYFDLHRMPELFCGFAQEPGEGPVFYPVACAPQAWAAASVFLLFQACLGLAINGPDRHVSFTRPQLPGSLGELRIHNLEVAGATVDLLLVRHKNDVGVNVLRREGDVQVTVVK